MLHTRERRVRKHVDYSEEPKKEKKAPKPKKESKPKAKRGKAAKVEEPAPAEESGEEPEEEETEANEEEEAEVAVEHCRSWQVFKKRAVELCDQVKKHFKHVKFNFTLNGEGAPRRGAFEISVKKTDGTGNIFCLSCIYFGISWF